MPPALINPNPVVYEKTGPRSRIQRLNLDEYSMEPIDQHEVFDLRDAKKYGNWGNLCFLPPPNSFKHHIKDIRDPEHPLSLEELKVVTEESIEVDDERSYVRVTFTPTMQHCSLSPTIGLCLRLKLLRSLPSRFKVDIRVAPGTLATEAAVNKQLNDKERVSAALENQSLLEVLEECLAPTYD